MPDHDDEQSLLVRLFDQNLRFPSSPRLIPDALVFTMPDGLGIQIRGTSSPVVLRGTQSERGLRYFVEQSEDRASLAEIIERRPPELPLASLARLLLVLHAKGVVCEGADVPATLLSHGLDDEVGRRQLLFWGRRLDLTRSATWPEEVQYRLSSASVALVATGLFGASTYDLLARSGCRNLRVLSYHDDDVVPAAVSDAPVGATEVARPASSSEEVLATIEAWAAEAELLVLATCDAPRDLLLAVNDLALATRVMWLPANWRAVGVEIGPLVTAGDSACYRCLVTRIASASPYPIEDALYEDHLAGELGGKRAHLGESVVTATLAASLVAIECIRAVTGVSPPMSLNATILVDPLTGDVSSSGVLRVPRCASCHRGAISLAGDPAGPAGPA